MDYLIDCPCGHDLTRHGPSGCTGRDSHCACTRSKLAALDGAIERARVNTWGDFLRNPVAGDAGTTRSSHITAGGGE